MNQFKKNVIVVSMFLSLLMMVSLVQAKDKKGALSPKLIKQIQSDFQMDTHTRAMQNALTAVDIKSIAENREILADHVHQFSHKIDTRGISNQQKSGRCWMFAGFNTLRPIILKKLELSQFEFSQIYLQFWDKFEKANTFYEYIIEMRERDLMDRDMVFLLKDPIPDGGYWENFVNLVEKYGVIPKEAMAESAASNNTGMMNQNLSRLLRKHADELRQIYQETGSVDKMRQAKPDMLAEVYKILVINLGQPPRQFTWRYKIKNKEAKIESAVNKDDEEKTEENDQDNDDTAKNDYHVEQLLSEPEPFTPQQFYKRFFDVKLRDYVNIFNDPIRPDGAHCRIKMTKNLYDGDNMNYANVDIERIKQMAITMLLDNQAVYFSADVSPNQDPAKGIMEADLYDFESVYMLAMDLDKRQRVLLRDSTVNHGMVFIGVDLMDDQTPVKWLVENSWGAERGKAGQWTMYDNWFDEYVFNIIVHKKYVPQDILDIFKKPAQTLPAWDPLW